MVLKVKKKQDSASGNVLLEVQNRTRIFSLRFGRKGRPQMDWTDFLMSGVQCISDSLLADRKRNVTKLWELTCVAVEAIVY